MLLRHPLSGWRLPHNVAVAGRVAEVAAAGSVPCLAGAARTAAVAVKAHDPRHAARRPRARRQGRTTTVIAVQCRPTAARATGVVSVLIGLTEILFPRKLERTMGIGNGQNTGVIRVLGVREICHGIDILSHDDLRKTLDLSQPVAILMVAVLHFVGEQERPERFIRQFHDAVVPGSYLVMSHGTGGEREIGFVTTIAYTGFLIGPPMIGGVAQLTNLSFAIGFVGALLGMWIQRYTAAPEIFTIQVGDTAFPIVWSIIGGVVFAAVVSLLTPRYRRVDPMI